MPYHIAESCLRDDLLLVCSKNSGMYSDKYLMANTLLLYLNICIQTLENFSLFHSMNICNNISRDKSSDNDLATGKDILWRAGRCSQHHEVSYKDASKTNMRKSQDLYYDELWNVSAVVHLESWNDSKFCLNDKQELG